MEAIGAFAGTCLGMIIGSAIVGTWRSLWRYPKVVEFIGRTPLKWIRVRNSEIWKKGQ